MNTIKNFYLDGTIADDNLVQTRGRLIDWVETNMRDRGYVPVLELDPQFNLDYDADKEHYRFKLTVFGTFVGKDKSWQISGISKGKSIPLSKSRLSLESQA